LEPAVGARHAGDPTGHCGYRPHGGLLQVCLTRMSRSRLTGAGSNSENIPTTMLRRNGRKGHAPIFVRPARGTFFAGNKAQRS